VFVFRDDRKFIRGRNERLFLANDSNRVLAQHSGAVRFSAGELRWWRRMLETRAAWLRQTSGAGYVLLVPPNAHAVYPEDLPDSVESAPQRPIHQLLSHLQQTGSFARVLYPLERIVAAKGDELPVYPKTDTHWSDYAQFLAYCELARAVAGDVEMHELTRANVAFTADMHVGDLGYKLEPHQRSLHVWARVLQPAARKVEDNEVRGMGSMIATQCDAAPDGTCLVLGDSYAYGMLPFLAASFRRMVFAQTPALDFELAEQEAPRLVVSVINERFMIKPPSDVDGPSVREMAEAKVAAGDVRPPSGAWGR
jgi:hypothetical protein